MTNRDVYLEQIAAIIGRAPTDAELEFAETIQCDACGAAVAQPCMWPPDLGDTMRGCPHTSRVLTAHYNAAQRSRSLN